MTPRPNALRIGLFALLGVALLAAAIVSVVGMQIFKTGDRVVMYFSGSVYGLQVGAPVVFRGVRLGTVRSVGVARVNGRFAVPVHAELDHDKLLALVGTADASKTPPLTTLLNQGLSAQLATQSLLTGQLYVDMDLRGTVKSVSSAALAAPDAGAAGAGAAAAPKVAGPASPNTTPMAAPLATSAAAQLALGAAGADGAVEVPTSLTRFQSLQEQLDRVDVDRMSKDLAATLAAARGLVAGPELKQALAELTQAAAGLARVSATLNQRLPPLTASAGQALQRTGAAADQLGAAAQRMGSSVASAGERVGQAGDRVGAAADRAQAVLAPGSPLLGSVQGAADELQRTAAALRDATGDQGATVQQLQRALADVSRAARAVRALADQIEQQPQSLIRGREATP